MRLRVIAFPLSASALALTSVLAMSSQAQAIEPPSGTVCTNKYADPSAPGVACFKAYGDKVYIGDTQSDGLRAIAVVWTDDFSGGPWECHDANGARNGWKECNYNFPENKTISLFAAGRNGATGPNEKASFPISTTTG